MALLEVKHLHTFFKTRKGIVKAVNDVSYSLEPGRTIGIVGESGSGKSVSAMSILRLLDGNGYIDSGEVLFEGEDLTKMKLNDLYKVRGDKISVIFQEPMTSLNPVYTIEEKTSRARSHKNARRGSDSQSGCGCQSISASVIGRYASARYDSNGFGLQT